MKSIKTAVIGTGFIGPAHIEALRRVGGIEVVAVASQKIERAQALAERFAIPKAYGGWKEVIADNEIQAVHNCTPNSLHFGINKAAILAGKHIVSEKPLTMTSKESAELVKLASKHGVVNAINFNYRFYPLIQHARAMVNKGELGKIYLVHGHYLQDWLYYDTDYNWRLETEISGASRAVADIGSHWCDLVQFIAGLRIKSVFADLVTIHQTRKKTKKVVETFKGKEEVAAQDYEEKPIKTEDAGIVMLQFENGARGVFTVSQVSAGRKNCEWFEIDGSKKAIAWDQEEPNQLWVGYRERPNETIIKDPALLDEAARKYAHYPGGHPEGYPDGPKNLFMNVYNFIRAGKDPRKDHPDFPTFADGHWENKIIEAVLKSNKAKKWVVV
ncbi:MAG: Inositol 2-dehydrogenase/D-chiro-inositol 3-dehydrogenase [bacterium]|nr:Inositol 2-dehydrogenase/D-chiro-inositol 3-dehydrogenase [bacterium]